MFWAFSGGTDVLTSPDGVTWTLREVPPAAASAAAMAEGSNVAFLLGLSNNAVQATTSTAAASANLTVSATSDGGAAVSYQWQRSLDAGTNWANVTNATTSTLSLTGLTAADSGTRYRVLASATGASTITSQSAILTVTG
jgi:cytoskeletal protein RodZ